MSKPTAIDLFCGAGGFSLGLEKAGYDVLFGVELNEGALKTYRENFGHEAIRANLAELNPKDAGRIIGIAPHDIDVIAGGPPCKGFSQAGERRPGDVRNDLAYKFWDWVGYYRPRYALMENVPGLLTHNNGETIEAIRDYASDYGYDTTILKVNSADFGVAQSRERIIVVGSSCDDLPMGVRKTTDPTQYRTVRDAIGDLPELSAGEISEEFVNHKATPHKPETVEHLKTLAPGESVRPSYNQQRRLIWDEPSWTLVGDRWQFVHPDQPRAITVRERARLHSFPDSWEFFGTVRERRGQVSNAVPPKLGEAVARVLDL